MINIAKGSLQRVLPGSPSLGGRKPGNIFLTACDLQGSRGFKSLSRRLVFCENVILERSVACAWPYSARRLLYAIRHLVARFYLTNSFYCSHCCHYGSC